MDTIKPSDFSAGLMANLAGAAAKAGISPTDFDRLWRNKKKMLALASMLHGDDIDCAGTPFIPSGLEYKDEDQIKSAYRGTLKAGKIFSSMYLDERQKVGVLIGETLKLALEGKLVLTAHCLDFVLRPENQHLIPDELKGKALFFWGSIYRDSHGSLFVRYLFWLDDRLCSSDDWLGDGWDASHPAAMLEG